MRRAALFVAGRVVCADSHVKAFMSLARHEKADAGLVSGFFDPDTSEFSANLRRDHFYDKEIYLVRHGAPADDGPDPEITEGGAEQVLGVALALCGRNVAAFAGFTSPLLRCLRTAAILQQATGVEFEVVPDLAEPAGPYRVPCRAAEFPQFRWPGGDGWDLRPDDLPGRVEQTLRRLPAKSIVVSHYGAICLMAQCALCDEKVGAVADRAARPASVTHINRTDIECGV